MNNYIVDVNLAVGRSEIFYSDLEEPGCCVERRAVLKTKFWYGSLVERVYGEGVCCGNRKSCVFGDVSRCLCVGDVALIPRLMTFLPTVGWTFGLETRRMFLVCLFFRGDSHDKFYHGPTDRPKAVAHNALSVSRARFLWRN